MPSAVAANEHPLHIIERVARDRTVDVDKLGKLIELQKEMMRVQAKIDFDQAFAAMTPELPVVKKRGMISGKNRAAIAYARLGEDIHPVDKPILTKHGFAIRHRTEWPADRPGMVRVIGVLTHKSGHSEESAFEGPSDQSDYRTHIQSLGSTVSYGRRYTTVDLLNLTVHGADDDGRRAPKDPPPDEYYREREEPAREPRRQPREDPPRRDAEEPISDPQRKRLDTITINSGRGDQEVDEWLLRRFNYKNRGAVKRGNYEYITRAIEASGPLPEGRR